MQIAASILTFFSFCYIIVIYLQDVNNNSGRDYAFALLMLSLGLIMFIVDDLFIHRTLC